MNIEIGPLTMVRNLYTREFQQIVERLLKGLISKNYIFVVNQILKHHFYIIFKILVYAVRMVFNKIILQMTDDKVGKFMRSIFFKAVINGVKKSGLLVTVGNGCIQCLKMSQALMVLILVKFCNFQFSKNYFKFLSTCTHI